MNSTVNFDPWSHTTLIYKNGKFQLTNEKYGVIMFLLSLTPDRRMGISKINPRVPVRYVPFIVDDFYIVI